MRKTSLLGKIIFLIVLVYAIQIAIPFVVAAAIGFGLFQWWKKSKATPIQHKKAEQISDSLEIQELKAYIKLTDKKLKKLEKYQEKEKWDDYLDSVKQILPQLTHIKDEADRLKKEIEPLVYKRIIKKVHTTRLDIQEQLEKLGLSPDLPETDEEKNILHLAPELSECYHNIQKDNLTILEKIKQADNHEELIAIHQSNMKRFEDILSGYLKIKANPKDYYNADERLAQAKEAIEKFDLDLDETLRQLNESELKDFEISLRMMQHKKTS
ncbi:hypothetical protein [Streptococcus pacificus]|uniref:Membrane associated protein n=1 Tax=Streptococcus pacificus TaxID=2740577 RepID=A0ABS0ZKL8_9STRE|nr:hypothetical protein [Streptococcus pacificus]MBJ8326443.1 hypothetical protein [Streptococcus pacificus]